MAAFLKIGITCYPSVDGSGILATELGTQLAKRGHEVHFISYEMPFRLDTSPSNVFFHPVKVSEYELFKYPDYTLPLSVKMAEIGRQFGLDILHVHYAVPHAVAAILACQMLGTDSPRVITTLHGTDTTLLGKDPNYQPIIKHAIEQSDGVTAVSRSLREQTKSTFGIKKEIEVIHNFFEPREPTKTRRQVRDELGLEDEFLVLHMSNLRPPKRIDHMLQIIAAAKHREKLKLLILAGGNFAPYVPLVRRLGIERQVEVKEYVLDIENYLNAADLGLYTSQHESFGLSILECMFYGHPVLTTNAGGILEVVLDGETGFAYRVGDTASFVEGLDYLIDNPARLRELGAAGQKRAGELFNSERIVNHYVDYYREVLNDDRPTRY